MKENVLQLIGSFHLGGSERQAVQLTRLLKEDGTVNVFAATLNREGVLLEEMEKLGLPEIPEFKLSSFYDLNFAVQLQKCVKFLRKNKITIVQTHDFYTNVFGIIAAKIAGTRLKIASRRDTTHYRTKSQITVEKQIFRMSDVIVANSEAVRDYLSELGVSPQKIDVIYNGLDMKRFEFRGHDRKSICASFGLPDDENLTFITSVANLQHSKKNLPMFLRMAEKILKEFPDVHFVIAGEGDLRPDLEHMSIELKIDKNVHFIGRCTRVPELLSISYSCVLTSLAEGFSNSILEYMGAEKPVVATDVTGISEAVIEGETGFLVASNDHEAMANRLIELLIDKEKAAELGKRGKIVVKERFSTASQLRKTLELYNL